MSKEVPSAEIAAQKTFNLLVANAKHVLSKTAKMLRDVRIDVRLSKKR